MQYFRANSLRCVKNIGPYADKVATPSQKMGYKFEIPHALKFDNLNLNSSLRVNLDFFFKLFVYVLFFKNLIFLNTIVFLTNNQINFHQIANQNTHRPF